MKRKLEKPYRSVKEITTERRGKEEGKKTAEKLTPKQELGATRERVRVLRFRELFKRTEEQIDYITQEPSSDRDEASLPEYEEFIKLLEEGDKNDYRPFFVTLTERLGILRALVKKIEKEIERLKKTEEDSKQKLEDVEDAIIKSVENRGLARLLEKDTRKNKTPTDANTAMPRPSLRDFKIRLTARISVARI